MRTIIEIWSEQPGAWFCLSTKRRDASWTDHFVSRDDFDDIAAMVRRWVEEKRDVFWCPHSFFDRRRLAKYYAAPSRMLWADLDHVDGRSLRYVPSLLWRTSPRRQAGLWLLNGEPSNALRAAFNRAIGADAGGYCLTKVLRLPGTVNWKPQYHRPVVKWLQRSRAVYSLAKLEEEYGTGPGRPQAGLVTFKLDGLGWREVIRQRGCEEILHLVTGRDWGDRSVVIWKIGRTLAEAGATASEIAVVLLASKVWQSKWGGNRRALEREVGRMIGGD